MHPVSAKGDQDHSAVPVTCAQTAGLQAEAKVMQIVMLVLYAVAKLMQVNSGQGFYCASYAWLDSIFCGFSQLIVLEADVLSCMLDREANVVFCMLDREVNVLSCMLDREANGVSGRTSKDNKKMVSSIDMSAFTSMPID